MRYRKLLNIIISILLHVLLLLTAYVFQGAFFPYIRLGGLVPLLLPVVATGIALYEGRDKGGIYGLFAGILCDISFNQPVGTFTLVLTVVGVGVGILADTLIFSNFASYYISCTAVLIVCAIIQMTPVIAVPNNIPVSVIMQTVINQTIYALVFALPIWFAVRALGRRSDSTSSSRRTTT